MKDLKGRVSGSWLVPGMDAVICAGSCASRQVEGGLPGKDIVGVGGWGGRQNSS